MKFLDLLVTAFVNCALLMLIKDVGPASAASATGGKQRVALLIIDVQDCFLPPLGSQAVADGDQVIPVINKIRRDYGHLLSVVVLSQDWHCPDHVSFASQHPPNVPYTVLNLTYNAQGQLCRGENVPNGYKYAVQCTGELKQVQQTLWPDHCVQNVTSGNTSAAFATSLTREASDIVIHKGDSCGIDSYSAFFDNGGFHQTALERILKDRNIGVVVVTGLALDYCVYFTSKDAHKLGYTVLTVTDAARGVAPDSTAAALKDLQTTGVRLIKEADLGEALRKLTGSAASLSTSPLVFLALMAAFVLTSFPCQ